MIEPTDLKINNLIEHNGLPWKVSGIHSPKPLKDKRFSDKWVIELFDGYSMINVPIDEVEAIPISEEWLRKFGYWWDNVDLHFTEVNSPITLENNFVNDKVVYSIFLSAARDSGESFLRVVDSIHQIQNIYLDLSEKELTLTT